MPVLLDTESRSRADLKKVGGRVYWDHPSSEVLCCVCYDTDSGDVDVWERGEPRPAMIRDGVVLGAHNMMGFDRFALARLGWRALDAGPELIDTSEIARAAGLPGGLDELATRWLDLEKDKAASKFTKGLSSVRRPAGKKNPHAIAPADWNALDKTEQRERGVLPACGPAEMGRVVPYCISDVEVLAHGWPLLESWQGIEPAVQRVDRAINERGICFDSQLARRLLEEDAINGERVCEATALVCGLTAEQVRKIARSDSQFPAFTGLPNAQKETLAEALLGNWLSPEARAMCAARDALASIARGKLTAGLARVSPDGRLRDTHKYLGGHTWRWSHTGMQLGNMARPDKRFEEWTGDQIEALADQVLAGAHVGAEEIDLLVRACLHAKPGHSLVVEDFSGVEARFLAWCSGDRKALAVHTGPQDPYKVAAAAIFGLPYDAISKEQRQAGKVSELACGYQGGPGAIERFAKKLGVDLEATGADARKIVYGWRALHAPVCRFWDACNAAMTRAINGEECEVACFRFVPSSDGRDVAVLMPNGRPIVYNETKIGRDQKGRPRITYMGRESYGGFPEDLYGGKIAENLVQSGCRELLAEAMVELEGAGLPVVLHVHDEAVTEVPTAALCEARAEQHRIMTTVPAWAEGFPLGAAGHFGKRYRK